MDHSQCVVETLIQSERHTCPRCLHGVVRGYDLTLTGDPNTDAWERKLKLHVVDSMTCSDSYHVAAMERP
jgi:hypothetical protein